MKSTLTVVISAFNEEKDIKECLESAKKIADEIIVMDNSSTDKTGMIARKYTKKVFKQKNNPNDIDTQKNVGIKKATSEWVFVLDADERISDELAGEIRIVIESNRSEIVGYSLPRKNIIFGKWIQNSLWWPDYQLRLFRKGSAIYTASHVHEQIHVDGETQNLTEPLIHHNYATISQWLSKMEIYTTNEAISRIKNGDQVAWYDAIRFPMQDFLKTFFYQNGYRDGLHGLVLSLLQAFYMEIVFAKMWEQHGFMEYNDSSFFQNFLSELKSQAKDFQYWVTTVSLSRTKNPIQKTLLKMKRKMR